MEDISYLMQYSNINELKEIKKLIEDRMKLLEEREGLAKRLMGKG